MTGHDHYSTSGKKVVACDQETKKISPVEPCMVDDRPQTCELIPSGYGYFCQYERDIIDLRRENLQNIYNNLEKLSEAEEQNQKLPAFCTYEYNPLIATELCEYYMNDLKRDRGAHGLSGGSSKVRRAAYMSRLVAKHKPIILRFPEPFMKADRLSKMLNIATETKNLSKPHEDEDLPEWFLRLNQTFSILTFYYYLGVKEKTLEKLPNRSKIDKIIEFTLIHRDPDVEMLMALGQTIVSFAEFAEMRDNSKEEKEAS